MSAVNELFKKHTDAVEELIIRVGNYAWDEMPLREQGEMKEEAAVLYASLRTRLVAAEKVAAAVRDNAEAAKQLRKTIDEYFLGNIRVPFQCVRADLDEFYSTLLAESAALAELDKVQK